MISEKFCHTELAFSLKLQCATEKDHDGKLGKTVFTACRNLDLLWNFMDIRLLGDKIKQKSNF